MSPLFAYLLKVNIALALFYLAYRYGLRRLTFYGMNRFFLLFAIAFSSVYPLIDVGAFLREQGPAGAQVIRYLPDLGGLASADPFAAGNILEAVFWSGVALMAGRFLLQLASLVRMHASSRSRRIDGRPVRIVREKINPFSFFRNIYINPLLHSPQEQRSILEHEQVHVKEWHTADILTGELNRIFYWFNPGAWLMMTAIRENLEFLTDRRVLRGGMDPKIYQYSLVKASEIPYASSLANNFSFSHLKIRITMMDKKPSSELHLVKYLVLVPFVAAAALAFNVSKAGSRETVELKAPAEPRPPAGPEEQAGPNGQAVDTGAGEMPAAESAATEPSTAPEKAVADTPDRRDDTTAPDLIVNTPAATDEKGRSILQDSVRLRRIIIDGKEKDDRALNDLPPGDIYSINVIKGKGKDDLLIVTTKKGRPSEGLTEETHTLQKRPAKHSETSSESFHRNGSDSGYFDSVQTLEDPRTDTDVSRFTADSKVDLKEALLVVDGKITRDKGIEDIDADEILSISVLKGRSAIEKYGKKGEKGVIIITTKK